MIQIPFCSSCGSNVEAGKRFCENCGAPLATTPAATPQYISPPPPAPAFAPQQVPAQQKSAGLAAVASFLCPGLGQTYNGSFGKGLLILIGTLIGSMIFTIPGIIIWLYGVYDAYSTAKKMNEGQLPFVPHSTMHMLAFIVIVIVIFIIYFIIIMAAMVAMMGAYTPYGVPTAY